MRPGRHGGGSEGGGGASGGVGCDGGIRGGGSLGGGVAGSGGLGSGGWVGGEGDGGERGGHMISLLAAQPPPQGDGRGQSNLFVFPNRTRRLVAQRGKKRCALSRGGKSEQGLSP